MSLATKTTIPKHVGIILDGNRRWAAEQGLPTLAGHKAGYDNLKTISDYALSKGVKYLTAYAFSTENWQRDPKEVSYLIGLLSWVLEREVDYFFDKGVRLHWLGFEEGLDKELVAKIKAACEHTAKGRAGTFGICFNYGGRQDVVSAANKLIKKGEPITEAGITDNLSSAGLPDPDLIIRTSGEQRLSNFLMWESAYSELYFSPKKWPDFDVHDFDAALEEFAARGRRYGV